MSCPTCDHTMEHIGTDDADGVFWCPRCGTIRKVSRIGEHAGCPEDVNSDYTPKLVEQCRELEQVSVAGPGSYEDWYAVNAKRLGITEAIHKPEDRPQ